MCSFCQSLCLRSSSSLGSSRVSKILSLKEGCTTTFQHFDCQWNSPFLCRRKPRTNWRVEKLNQQLSAHPWFRNTLRLGSLTWSGHFNPKYIYSAHGGFSPFLVPMVVKDGSWRCRNVMYFFPLCMQPTFEVKDSGTKRSAVCKARSRLELTIKSADSWPSHQAITVKFSYITWFTRLSFCKDLRHV